MAEPIGSIPVEITGDYSSLQKDLQQAETIARQSGKKIGEALGQGFDSAGAATREYSSDAQALIDTQKKLDIQLANTAGTLAEIRNAYEAGAVSANVLARAENEMAQASAAANTALERVAESQKMAARAAAEHAAEMQKTVAAIKQAGQELQSMGTALTASVTLPLIGLGTAALVVAGNLEQSTVAFKTLLGSTIQAQNHLEELKKFALSTPFEFTDLVEASKKLQALGFTAKEIIPTLTAVGNAAAGLGTGAQGIERITLALGQMLAKGKVSAGEMKQLAEAGIPAWQILADAISKAEGKVISVADVMKRSEKGLIDSNMAVTALLEGMQAKFGGLMEAQSKTLLGVWSNFKDKVTFVLGDIGEALAPLAKQMVMGLTDAANEVDKLVEQFKGLPIGVQEATAAFVALAAAAGPVLFIVGQLTSAVGSIIGLWTTLGLSMEAVATAASMVLVPLAAIGVVFAGIHLTGLDSEVLQFATTLKDNLPGIVDFFQGAIDWIKKFASEYLGLKNLPTWKEITTTLGLFKDNALDLAFAPFANLRDLLKDVAPLIERVGGSYKSMGAAAQLVLDNLTASQTEANNKLAAMFPGPGSVPDKPRAKPGEDAAKAATAIKNAFSELGLTDTTKQVKDLNAAFDLLAKSGKLDTDQLAEAQKQLAFKIQQVQQAVPGYITANEKAGQEIEKVLKKTQDDADKTGEAFLKAWLKWEEGAAKASSKQTVIDSVKEWNLLPPAIQKAVVAQEKLTEANRFFGITADDSGQVVTKAFAEMEVELNSSKTTLDGVQIVWSKMGSVLNKLSQTDAPLAIKGFQDLIDKAIQLGATAGQVLQMQAAEMQAVINAAEQTGTSATVAIEALENIRLKQEQLKIQTETIGNVYKGLMKSFADVFDNLDKGLTKAIVDGGSLGDVFKGLLKSFETDVVGTFVHGFTEGLKNAFLQSGVGQAISGFLTTIFQKVFGGLFDLGIKTAATAPQLAATTANTTALATNTAAITALTSAMSTQGAANAAGSVPGGGGSGGGLGGLASGVTAISSVVTAITSVLQFLQGRRMEQDIGRIEVTTRGILNQLISIQDSLNTYLPQLPHLVDIWAEIMVTNDILRLMGQNGGGLGGGSNNGADPDFAQHLADAINNNPSNSAVDTSMQDLATSLDAGVQAANDYNAALETTASTAYSLDSAVSSTTDSLMALNDATKQVNGALPGFTDGMDRAVFNSMMQPGQNLSPGGARMNATPYIMPVPVPEGLTGPQGVTQGAMLQHSNASLAYPSIAPVVGTQGVGSGGGAKIGVYVTAVDPTSRSVTQGIITGLEEVGIRTR